MNLKEVDSKFQVDQDDKVAKSTKSVIAAIPGMTPPSNQVTYTDYVLAGRMLGRELKEKGCDYVIALTHMRTPNDVRS